MAEFKSQYLQLGFYVKGEYKQFNDGRYVTEDIETIKVLSKINDAQRIDEALIAEEAPKPKAPGKKSSGK